jgi:hypothetical protein
LAVAAVPPVLPTHERSTPHCPHLSPSTTADYAVAESRPNPVRQTRPPLTGPFSLEGLLCYHGARFGERVEKSHNAVSPLGGRADKPFCGPHARESAMHVNATPQIGGSQQDKALTWEPWKGSLRPSAPTCLLLPARFPLRGRRDLHLPHQTRSLRSRPRARPRQTLPRWSAAGKAGGLPTRLSARWSPGAQGTMATYPEANISLRRHCVLSHKHRGSAAQAMGETRRCLILRGEPLEHPCPALRLRFVLARNDAGGAGSQDASKMGGAKFARSATAFRGQGRRREHTTLYGPTRNTATPPETTAVLVASGSGRRLAWCKSLRVPA